MPGRSARFRSAAGCSVASVVVRREAAVPAARRVLARPAEADLVVPYPAVHRRLARAVARRRVRHPL